MSCKGPLCSDKNVTRNATHARLHLLAIPLAGAIFPSFRERLAPSFAHGSTDAIDSDVALTLLPPLPVTTLDSWGLRLARGHL